MGLTAIVNGERVTSFDRTPEEWLAIKEESKAGNIVMPVTDAPGIAKTSPLGLYFFAHKPGHKPEDYQPETMEHLLLKAAVAQEFQKHGWDVTTEFVGPERAWIADVYATKGDHRIAIEAQWSYQTEHDYHRRQERYADYDVECFWLVRNDNHLYSDLPFFKIETSSDDLKNGAEPMFSIEYRKLNLEQLVTAIIKCQYRMGARVKFIVTECWKCKNFFIGYYSEQDKEDSSPKKIVLTESCKRAAQYVETVSAMRVCHYELRHVKKRDDDMYVMVCPHCRMTQSASSIRRNRQWHVATMHVETPYGRTTFGKTENWNDKGPAVARALARYANF